MLGKKHFHEEATGAVLASTEDSVPPWGLKVGQGHLLAEWKALTAGAQLDRSAGQGGQRPPKGARREMLHLGKGCGSSDLREQKQLPWQSCPGHCRPLEVLPQTRRSGGARKNHVEDQHRAALPWRGSFLSQRTRAVV